MGWRQEFLKQALEKLDTDLFLVLLCGLCSSGTFSRSVIMFPYKTSVQLCFKLSAAAARTEH